MKRLFTQFSFPGGIPSHVGAGDARARSTRAASSATRCPTPTARPSTIPDLHRRLRRRRRRGRDRAAGDELALQQVPQPGARRRGAADPAPQRLQDRQPDRAGPHQPRGAGRRSSAATATSPISSRATSRQAMHQLMAATLDTVVAEIQRHPGRRARQRLHGSARAGR